MIPAKPQYDRSVKPAEKRLKVAAYCRVSTELEQQESSYEAQVEYYTNKIEENQNWKNAGIYADDGKSATNTKKRDDFNTMIKVLICTLLSPLSCSLLLSQHHLFCILIEPSAKSYHPFLPFSLAVKRKVEDISSTFCISIIQVNILFTFSSTYSTASSKKPSS